MVEPVFKQGDQLTPVCPVWSQFWQRKSRLENPVVPSGSAQSPTESWSPSPAELSQMWHSKVSHFQLPVICKIVKNGYSQGVGSMALLGSECLCLHNTGRFYFSGLFTCLCAMQLCLGSPGPSPRMAWRPPSRWTTWATSTSSSSCRTSCATQPLPGSSWSPRSPIGGSELGILFTALFLHQLTVPTPGSWWVSFEFFKNI